MVNLEIKEVTTGKNNENKGNVSAYVKETGFTISIDQTMQLVSFANQIKGSARTLVNCCEDVAKMTGLQPLSQISQFLLITSVKLWIAL